MSWSFSRIGIHSQCWCEVTPRNPLSISYPLTLSVCAVASELDLIASALDNWRGGIRAWLSRPESTRVQLKVL
jgi:hypothetical protein